MAKTFYLRLLLVGQDDLICEVRSSEADRLRERLSGDSACDGFFWFDTIDGRSIIFNLEHLQGARYLWDVAAAPPDSRANPDTPLTISLLGKALISEAPSEVTTDTYTLFCELELGDQELVTFADADGEEFTLVARQVVYLSAPKNDLDEGRRHVDEEGGLA